MKNLIFILLSISLFHLSCEGPAGSDGENGSNGENGTNGAIWYSGQGIPDNILGTNGDFYLDTDESIIYVKENDAWTIQNTIKGADGNNGNIWHVGEDAPVSDVGDDGDFYLNILTSDIYQKVNGSWVLLINIKGNDGDYDKQIRLKLITLTGIGAPSTEWTSASLFNQLIKFNKMNYANVDSAIFVALLNTDNFNNTVFTRLYNVTDDTPIENSELSATLTDGVWKQTSNIYNDLPSTETDLSLQVKKSNNGEGGSILQAYLFLYRK